MEKSKKANPGPLLKDTVDVSCQKVFPIIRKRERGPFQDKSILKQKQYTSVRGSITHNSRKVGITRVREQMMDKQNVDCIHGVEDTLSSPMAPWQKELFKLKEFAAWQEQDGAPTSALHL